ncbi:ARMT1-like domain-containing protein [Candidatus Haliotispira prima]|uniref:ARMT1-like domain-containing protein n=1 Tax=Candidatus Haliotispira prima TaxID=3034016 RepID=A0ABY8MGL5_9SPIO|nr:ARMT1-like domain-containing protein [Candidatus Haliotispira prima]
MAILDFIQNNYHWIFGGIGVPVLVFLSRPLVRFLRNRNTSKDIQNIDTQNIDIRDKDTPNDNSSSTIKAAEYFTARNDEFARFTINTRFREVYSHNCLGKYLGETIVEKLDFCAITPNNVWRDDENYRELESLFTAAMKDYIGITLTEFYQDAPFILVEHYFYYKILLDRKKKKKFDDPYKDTKIRSLSTTQEEVLKLLNEYQTITKNGKNALNKDQILKQFVQFSLFGNTTDLSQNASQRAALIEPVILKDQFDLFVDYISNIRVKIKKIDILIDNTGIELLADLVLSLVLLELEYVEKVHFHVNILPVFVSDTIQSEYGDDFKILIDYLEKLELDTEIPSKYKSFLDDKKIEIKPNLFWNMHLDFKEHNLLFNRIIGQSDLIIVKGDLNFRRLIQDKTWKNDESFGELVSYLKVPCLVLRTIKSSTIVGLDAAMMKQINESDSINKTNGKYATIFFNQV